MPAERLGLGFVQLLGQRAAGRQDRGSQLGFVGPATVSTMTASSHAPQNARN